MLVLATDFDWDFPVLIRELGLQFDLPCLALARDRLGVARSAVQP